MHRIPAVIAVLGLSALSLAACSSAPGTASCDRVDSTASVLDLISGSGDAGSPAVAVDGPVAVDETVFTDEVVGDGPRLTSDAQDVMFSVSIANGTTGETILSSGTQVQPLSGWRTDYDGLVQMMMCATEGSRIVGAIPASDLSDAAAQNFGLTDGQSIAITLDLQRVYLAAADGTSQYNDRRGMPSVVLAPDGNPGVIVPDVAPPAELAVEELKKGDGAVVADGDSVRVHALAVGWDKRTVTSSTWDEGSPKAVTTSDDSVAYAAQLVGQAVGSQLLVVVPSDDGSDATIYVVDILGIDTPAATQ